MQDTDKAWVDAGKHFAADPKAEVSCPDCGKANLVAQDIRIEASDKFERIMQCPSCGSWNALLMTKKN